MIQRSRRLVPVYLLGVAVVLWTDAVANAQFACCLPVGECQDLSPMDCEDQGGDCIGCIPARVCSEYPPDICDPASGACCDGVLMCTEVTEADCTGNYLGDDTICEPGTCDPPELGACCTGKGCVEVFGEDNCPAEGGYRGDGTSCKDADVCDPLGACCEDEICSIANESLCQGADQSYQGADSLCTPDPCVIQPEGACCTDDGEVISCSSVPAAECAGPNQVFQGLDTTCSPDPCNDPEPGACCTDDGGAPTCEEVLETDCQGVNQSFSAGGVCDPDPCVVGACCSSDGLSVNCSVGTPDDCVGDGDIYLGDGSVCTMDACGAPCETVADCADDDGDGIRDDNCVWTACESLQCVVVDIPFADAGGGNGACPPDLATDGNDRFHALNCFSNIATTGAFGYPCELAPPSAFNVDVGGPTGLCCPDGVCDGNDAFHALNAFSGATACACPANGGPSFACPCPTPTEPPGDPVLCPPGPAPTVDISASRPSRWLDLTIVPRARAIRGGEIVQVDIFTASAVSDLRGYQLHLAARGGVRGSLGLVDIHISPPRHVEQAFAGLGAWSAFNVETGQMVAGLDSLGVAVPAGRYLATFTFRAARGARGQFRIELLHGEPLAEQRTFLFSSPQTSRLGIGQAPAAHIRVHDRGR